MEREIGGQKEEIAANKAAVRELRKRVSHLEQGDRVQKARAFNLSRKNKKALDENAAVETERRKAAECQKTKAVDADRKFQVLDHLSWLGSKVSIRSSRVKDRV